MKRWDESRAQLRPINFSQEWSPGKLPSAATEFATLQSMEFSENDSSSTNLFRSKVRKMMCGTDVPVTAFTFRNVLLPISKCDQFSLQWKWKVVENLSAQK